MKTEEYIYYMLKEIREYESLMAYGLLEKADELDDKALLKSIHDYLDSQGGL